MSQILYVTGSSVTLYQAHRNGAQALDTFPCNDAGYSELVQLLHDAEPKPVAVLVDLIEEEFREESLPHTIGRDRSRLHTRQAKKLFRSTPFRYHRTVGRQREGRRDDQVLFSALTNRDNIEPMLEALDAASIPVKGIYSLPIITRHLVKPLASKADNILIVTEQPDGGLRETFIRGGRVHFSRLAPINENSSSDYCRIVKAEASKTQRYLTSLRLLAPNQPLDIYVLCDSSQLAALQEIPSDENNITIHPVNLAQVAMQLGFAEHADSKFSDALFCYLLQKKLTANHYAPTTHLRHWQTYKAKFCLRAATWLFAVGTATLTGMNIVDSQLMEREAIQVSQLTAQVRQDHQHAKQNLAIEPGEAIAMREALQMADQLNAYPANLEQLFTLLGNSFNKQPDLVMDKLKWFVTANPNEETFIETRQTQGPAQVTDAPYLVSNIKGHLRNFNGRYRQAHETIDRIVHWLESQPGVKSAEVITKPLNTRTDADLQGSIATKGDKEVAPFEMRIVMELSHESA